MAEIKIPDTHEEWLSPYQQEVFQYNTADSKVYVSRYTNNLLKSIGNDIVITGLEVSKTISGDIVTFTVSPGRAIIDSTLVVINSPTEFTYDLTSITSGRLILTLRYKYVETTTENPVCMQILRTDDNGVVIDAVNFDTQKDRIVLAAYEISRLDPNDPSSDIVLNELNEVLIKINSNDTGTTYKARPLTEAFASTDLSNVDPNTIINIVNNTGGIDADKLDGKEGSEYLDKATYDSNNDGVVDNADKLDGKEGSFYTNASNLNAGTVPVERLSGTYNIDITGNAANADKLDGHDSSYFATSNHNHDSRYVLKTGDTINGNLGVNGVINVGRQDNASEGGEICLAQSVNGDLTGAIVLDNYINEFRIFARKSNGHVGGIYIDLENTPDGIHTIWHSGNDGPGSGLDADKWDGGHKHVSSAGPSGGQDGDVWFRY